MCCPTMGKPRAWVIGLVACGTVALTACGNSPSQSGVPSAAPVGTVVRDATASQHISATEGLVFLPASITAHVNDVVEWTNTGLVSHTVTFSAFPYLTDVSLQPGATWEIRFSRPGTYRYVCTIHSGMVGSITVS